MQSVINDFKKALEIVSTKTSDNGAAVQAAATLVLANRLSDTHDLRLEFDSRLAVDASVEGSVETS